MSSRCNPIGFNSILENGKLLLEKLCLPLALLHGQLINNYYYIARLPSFVVVDLWLCFHHFLVPLPIQLVNYPIRLEEEQSFEKFQK